MHTLRDIYVYHVMLCKERLNGICNDDYTHYTPQHVLEMDRVLEKPSSEGSLSSSSNSIQEERGGKEFRLFTSRESCAIVHKPMSKTVKCPLDNPRDRFVLDTERENERTRGSWDPPQDCKTVYSTGMDIAICSSKFECSAYLSINDMIRWFFIVKLCLVIAAVGDGRSPCRWAVDRRRAANCHTGNGYHTVTGSATGCRRRRRQTVGRRWSSCTRHFQIIFD